VLRPLSRTPTGWLIKNNVIVVDRIEDGRITGHWWEGMERAFSPQQKDVYTFSEGDVLDWAIVRPNGVIEGNFGPSHLGIGRN
jgi:hypothetical protein